MDKIKDKNTRKRIEKAIDRLETASALEEIANIKKLTGFTHTYRLKVGDYRIGFIVENNIVELARVAHRKDIYNLFP